MVEFLKIQYRLGRVKAESLDGLVRSGKITEEEKGYIMA